MKVTLLPLDKQEVINKLYVACRTCYNAGTPNDMWKEIATEDALVSSDIIPFNLEKRIKLLKHVLDSQHLSVLEHCNITFLVSGVSRALTHQLVRHRHCSYSQQSQRYVEFKGGVFEYVTPKSIEKYSDILVEYETHMRQISQLYTKMTEAGIPAEDARMILPNACCTNIAISMNLRELMHICNERLCTCAQDEIRAMVREMAKLVSKELPFMKPYLVPKCEKLGYCNESPKRSCGRKKTRDIVLGE